MIPKILAVKMCADGSDNVVVFFDDFEPDGEMHTEIWPVEDASLWACHQAEPSIYRNKWDDGHKVLAVRPAGDFWVEGQFGPEDI